MRNHLVLSLALDPAGHHPAAWRLPSFDPACMTDAGHFVALGALAEDAGLDFLLAGYPVRSSALDGPAFSQSLQLEPLSLISALMINLRSIGLAASVPMAYWEPFNIARAFSALDNLSGGRAAWLAVPSSGPADEANFPRFAHQHIKAPYARALEFVELTRALWDSWEDDALKFDKENAIFTDRAKVHRIAYQKNFFASDGPLNAPRPVQGHPPILVSDVSAEGLAFGAAIADVVMARESSAAEAAALRARVTAQSLAGGRATAPLVLADLHFVLGKTDHAASAARAELDVLSGAGRPAMTGLHFTGTAGGLAELMLEWFGNGSCDGFQLLPAVMPRDLAMFAADVVPLLRSHDVFRGGYLGTSLREHLGLARPMGRVSARGEA